MNVENLNLELDGDTIVESIKYKTSNTYPNYHYVSCIVQRQVGGYDACFQTGHSYDHNDYSMPSNSMSLYDDGSDPVLAIIDNDSDLILSRDADFLAEINEKFKMDYSHSDLVELYSELCEARVNAQKVVNEIEAAADAWFKADTSVYVCTEYDESPRDYEAFDTQAEADAFIEASTWDARIADKEEAREGLDHDCV